MLTPASSAPPSRAIPRVSAIGSVRPPRAADALIGGPLAAVLSATSVLFRDHDATLSTWQAYVWVAGCWAPPCLGLVALGVQARRGMLLALDERGRAWVRASLLALAITLPAMATFGRLLLASTHHRALGGATYASGCCVLLVAVTLLTRRFAAYTERLRDPLDRFLVPYITLFVSLFLATITARRSLTATVIAASDLGDITNLDPWARSALGDALLLVLAILVGIAIPSFIAPSDRESVGHARWTAGARGRFRVTGGLATILLLGLAIVCQRHAGASFGTSVDPLAPLLGFARSFASLSP